MKNKAQWIIAIVSFLLAIVCFGVSSLFFVIGGILLLPVDKIRDFLQEKVKIKEVTAWVLAGVFMLMGCIVIPTREIEQDANISTSTYAATQSSNKTSNRNESSENSSSNNRNERDSSSGVSSGNSSSNNWFEKDSSSVITSESSSNNTSVQITYILNTSSKKIHYQSCYQADRISAANKATTTKSIEELKKAGYTTCGVCF